VIGPGVVHRAIVAVQHQQFDAPRHAAVSVSRAITIARGMTTPISRLAIKPEGGSVLWLCNPIGGWQCPTALN
jgi:hypothetical protein